MENYVSKDSSIGSGRTLTDRGFASHRASAYKIIKELEDRIAGYKAQVEFAEIVQKSSDNILIRDYAKILCDKSLNIGGNRLYSLLRESCVFMASNMPYQKFIDRGYFVVTEIPYNLSRKTKLRITPLVTPKGQEWLAKKVRIWASTDRESFKESAS